MLDKKVKEKVNMNLAEKIFKERTKLDLSQEQFAEQMNVSRQAVSKWETGQSLPELDKLVMMSRIFGVTTDYLLGEEAKGLSGEPEAVDEEVEAASSGNPVLRHITEEEVKEYQTVRKKMGKRIALGVFLCIMGLAVTYFVQEIVGVRVGALDFFYTLSAVLFLLFVLIAVALFIISGMTMGKWEFMKETNLFFSSAVEEQLKGESEGYYRVFIAKITVGVSLCITGIIVCVLFEGVGSITDSIWLSEKMGGFYLLLIVAVAVYLFVTAGIEKSTYDILLQKNEHRLQMKEMKRKKEENKIFEAVSSIYWCIVTAAYLGYSLITFDWGRSWIVWPVTGCLFGAVTAVIHLLNREK